MVERAVWKALKRQGLPEEAFPLVLSLSPFFLGRGGGEGGQGGTFPKELRLKVAEKLPWLSLEIPLEVLGGRPYQASPEEAARGVALLKEGLWPVEVALLFLWEAYAESGLSWEAVASDVLARVGEGFREVLEGARRRILERGLEPKVRRALA